MSAVDDYQIFLQEKKRFCKILFANTEQALVSGKIDNAKYNELMDGLRTLEDFYTTDYAYYEFATKQKRYAGELMYTL